MVIQIVLRMEKIERIARQIYSLESIVNVLVVSIDLVRDIIVPPRWNVQKKQFEPMEGRPPQPWGLYAGIGATSLTDEAETAIRELYANQALQAPDTSTGHRAVERC